MFGPGIGRVQHGVAERGGQLRQLDRQLREPLPRRIVQRDTGQREIAQHMLHRRTVRFGQPGELRRPGQRDQHVIKRAVLHHLQMVFDQPLLPGGKGFAQFGRVGHPVQMRYGGPDRRDSGFRALQRHPALREGGGSLLHDPGHDRLMIGNYPIERGRDVIGPDFPEARQCQRVEQGIGHL